MTTTADDARTYQMTVGDAAKKCATERLGAYQQRAPKFFATFTAEQLDVVRDLMGLTFIDGSKDGADRISEAIRQDIQRSEP